MLRTVLALLAPALLWAAVAPEAAARTPRPSKGSAEGEAITIAFGGDVTLSRHVGLVMGDQGADAPLRRVSELAAADLAIVNLESVVAASGERNNDVDGLVPHYFRGRPELLGVLGAAGVDVVTTANTHVLDYGPEALLEQQRHLSMMGIAAPGSGEDRDKACAPAYVEVRGLVVGVIAFDTTQSAGAAGPQSPGSCHLELDPESAMAELGPRVSAARKRADVVLVAAHWGIDFETDPTDAKRELGRELIEAGADAVLGSHAHRVQGLETHMDRPILHDAGNLLIHFGEAAEAAIFELTVTGDGVERIEFVPLVAEKGWTRRPSGAEAEDLNADFARRSARLGTTLENGVLSLQPPPRPDPARAAPIEPREAGPAPPPLAMPPDDCVVGRVPADASIEPVEAGPLTLLGVRSHALEPFVPGFIRVESFWRVDAPVDRPLLLVGAAGRDGPSGTPGWAEEQEPCDWEWPTTRWEVGTIYRDEMLLRPSDGLLSPIGAVLKVTGVGSPAPVRLGVADADGVTVMGEVVDRVSFGIAAWVTVVGLLAVGAAIAGAGVIVKRRRRWRRGRSAP